MEIENKQLTKYEKYCKGKPCSESLKRAKGKYYIKKKVERLDDIANGVDVGDSNYEKYVKNKPESEAQIRARKKYVAKKKEAKEHAELMAIVKDLRKEAGKSYDADVLIELDEFIEKN